MITSEHELRDLCQRALETKQVAIDTEFFWERSFYPQLGVVQLGLSTDELYLIDAVALPSLPGLGDVLADAGTQLILHDAVQDLQILSRHTGSLPRNIFDTRRAAGFAGLPSTISLANLLQELLQITLPKGETRSDWLQRPLSQAQYEYALDDIRHMHELCDRLCAMAGERGLAGALAEEMVSYDDPELYADLPLDAAYSRQKPGRWPLPRRPLLYTLSCWRETEARRLDRPRNHILQDADLLAIVQYAPGNETELNAVRGLARNTLLRHRTAILDAINAAAAIDPLSLPETAPREERMSTEFKQRVEHRIREIKEKAAKAGLDPALIGPKADITALVRYETEGSPLPPSRMLSGWRTAFLRQDVQAV